MGHGLREKCNTIILLKEYSNKNTANDISLYPSSEKLSPDEKLIQISTNKRHPTGQCVESRGFGELSSKCNVFKKTLLSGLWKLCDTMI